MFNVNQKGGVNKWTPLHLAAYTGKAEIIELLGMNGDINFLKTIFIGNLVLLGDRTEEILKGVSNFWQLD